MKKMDPFDFAATWMAYRQGQMTAEAANAFEAELAADPRLKALHEALLDPTISNEALLDLTRYDVETAYRRCCRPALTLRPYKRWGTAAAVLLLIAGTVAYVARPVPERQVFTAVDSTLWEDAPRITLSDGKTILLDTLTHVQTTPDLRLDNQAGLLNVESVNNVKEPTKEPSNTRQWHRLDVPFAQHYSLRLPDGTLATLHAGSTLEFPSHFQGEFREVRLIGEAYFEVASNKAQPFVVTLKGLRVTALGTAFNIQAYADDDLLQTTLIHGKVALEDSTGKINYLQPGQQANYSRHSGDLSVKTVDPTLYTAWKDDYFYFQGTSLETIMQQVGRWYGLDILYLNARNKHTKYTGKIKMYPTVEAVLTKFELAGDMDFEIDERCIRIKRK
ncbi:MAG TPA: hypothetical protein DD409_00545 [Bacteroidales bacterium]|nr:hypothetical protein [Bacteroidales bacterium]